MIPVIHTQPGEKIVTYFCTRNLYDVLQAAYNSLLAYNPGVHVYCFIEDDKLPFKTPKQVTCVNVTGQTLFPADGPNYRTRYSYMILLKAALTKIFPDADRALIMDVDTIVCHDITQLFDYDLSHAYYAAVTEPNGSSIRGVIYANFGVVLLNLQRLRDKGKDDEIIHELNTHKYDFPEQDAFNKICMNRFDPLPPDYNVTNFGFNITGEPTHVYVKHYAGFQDYSNIGEIKYWMTHTTTPPRYVVYAGDRRVYNMLIASVKSLLCHTRVDKIFLLIEDNTIEDAFTRPLPSCIECINVSNQTVFPVPNPNYMPWYGYMTTLRAGLTRILPSYVEQVLWLDPDTVVVDDISDLWTYDLTHHYFAAVEEVRNHNHTLKPYFNAGVMMMNLTKFAEDGKDTEVINEINTKHYQHLEQDVLNYLCYQHIRKLPSCYSDSIVSEPCTNPRIKHFVSVSKNGFIPAVTPFSSREWKDIPFANGGDNNDR